MNESQLIENEIIINEELKKKKYFYNLLKKNTNLNNEI